MIARIKNLDDMENFAKSFVCEIGVVGQHTSALVIGLQGELGAGKTTFTKFVAKLLGVREVVTSPTFVIEKIYKLSDTLVGCFSRLIHIDAYRLENGDDLINLGWEEIKNNSQNLIIIEWPEIISDILPPVSSDDVRILKFKVIDEVTREIEY